MLQEPHGPTTESFAGVNYLRIRDPDKTDCHAPANHPTGGATTIQRSHALQPHRGTEADFTVEKNPFAFTPGQLNKLLNPKSLTRFYAAGGLSGLEKGIRDRRAGLTVDDQNPDGYVSFGEAVRQVCKKIEPSFGLTSNRNERLIDRNRGIGWFETRASDTIESWKARERLLGVVLSFVAFICLEVIFRWLFILSVFWFINGLDWIKQVSALVWISMLVEAWLYHRFLENLTPPMLKLVLTCWRWFRMYMTAQLTYLAKWCVVLLLQGIASRRRAPVLRPKILEVKGILNGTGVVAIADTGACFNLISEKLATTMGLQPLPGTQGQISLPNGRQVKSPGQVELTFQFAGETPTHTILCAILPKSTRELVLGGAFLKATQTMTRHRHRLRKVASCHITPSLNLIGAGQDFLGGYLNGRECLAVPDTGSDIMVISMEYARSLCLQIHGKRRSRIQFLDGSQALTEGTVRAKWQFGPQDRPTYHKFHVLKGLPVNAILSSGVLDEFDVFRRYAHRIGSAESISFKGWQNPFGMGIFGISLVKRCEEEIKSLSSSFLDDITSDNPFTPEKIERERARRDEIRDTIAKIPYEAVRAAKQDEEHLRKWRWEDLRQRYIEENTSTRHMPMNSNGVGAAQVPLAAQPKYTGTGRMNRLMVDDINSPQAMRQSRTGLNALRRFFA